MRDITSSDIKAVFLSQSGKSKSHIGKFCTTIRAVFRSAYADGACTRDPCVTVQTPQGHSGTHRKLTEDEVRRICETAPSHQFGTAAMVLLYTGVRRGEMCAIDIDRDVDFERKTVSIRGAVSFYKHKPVLSRGKTANAMRVVPLVKPLAEFLQGKHGLVFSGRDGGLCTLDRLEASFESFRKKAGVPTVRMHDFRHNYCVWLFDAGVDMKTAQTWLGHADASMIMKVYDHLSEARQKAGAQGLEMLVNRLEKGQNEGQEEHEQQESPMITVVSQ